MTKPTKKLAPVERHEFEPDYDRRRCKVCGFGRANRVHG